MQTCCLSLPSGGDGRLTTADARIGAGGGGGDDMSAVWCAELAALESVLEVVRREENAGGRASWLEAKE